jgi:hypothetical protein
MSPRIGCADSTTKVVASKAVTAVTYCCSIMPLFFGYGSVPISGTRGGSGSMPAIRADRSAITQLNAPAWHWSLQAVPIPSSVLAVLA